MHPFTVVFYALLLLHCGVLTEDAPEDVDAAEAEKKLANQILAFIEHYKQEDPIGLPGVKIPDPMPVPTQKQSFPVATMTFNDMNIHGISKFRLIYIKSEISEMEVNAALRVDSLHITGNYTMSTWFSRSQGPFTVDLANIDVNGLANLAIERNGRLRAQDIKMDIVCSNITLNFENLGFMANIFQGIINSVGTFIFESIKPFVLKEAYTKIREEINNNLDKSIGDMQFPNSISPLDMVIAETRQKIRDMQYDPFHLNDYNHVTQFYRADLTNTWITGLSSFYRMGNISLKVENNTLIADVEVGTHKLEGKTHWDLSIVGGLMSRAGIASFSVEYITVRIIMAQPLDTRKRPQFRDIQIELGNIQARCDGAGTLDYVIEFTVNILPNLLRYQIMDAIEGPIRDKVQEKFNTINVEETIKSKLYTIKDVQIDIPLMHLKSPEAPPIQVVEEEDEFWKFD